MSIQIKDVRQRDWKVQRAYDENRPDIFSVASAIDQEMWLKLVKTLVFSKELGQRACFFPWSEMGASGEIR